MRKQDLLTYRHPRTTLEAFGCDASNACAVEHHMFRTQLAVRWVLRFTTMACLLGVVWGLV